MPLGSFSCQSLNPQDTALPSLRNQPLHAGSFPKRTDHQSKVAPGQSNFRAGSSTGRGQSINDSEVSVKPVAIQLASLGGISFH